MELQTISQVSKHFNISTRTLRYYEQIGLIQAVKKDFSLYRSYDADTVLRLQQIIVLRKLRIPLKQIAEILQSEDAAAAIEIFQRNLNEIDDEITALSTIRSIIQSLLERLHVQSDSLRLLDDMGLLQIADSLTASKIKFKEDKTMTDLDKASKALNKLTDVRIIYLPPFTVAAIRCFSGEREAEHYTSVASHEFIKSNDLLRIKPDLRRFGFNNGRDGIHGYEHGYEEWTTIPDDMEVAPPFEKKRFAGGMYAAHLIPEGGDFEDWKLLEEWVNESEQYEIDVREPKGMGGHLEETFDTIYLLGLADNISVRFQIDLLMPIKLRTEKKQIRL